jgi:hypothetical protein
MTSVPTASPTPQQQQGKSTSTANKQDNSQGGVNRASPQQPSASNANFSKNSFDFFDPALSSFGSFGSLPMGMPGDKQESMTTSGSDMRRPQTNGNRPPMPQQQQQSTPPQRGAGTPQPPPRRPANQSLAPIQPHPSAPSPSGQQQPHQAPSSPSASAVVPASPGQSDRRVINPVTVPNGQNFVDITEYLNMPQSEAAKKLGIPPSTLSKRWKEAVRNRKWPWRVVCKLDKEIMTLLHNVPQGAPIPEEIEGRLGYLMRKRQEELKPVVIRL